MNERLPRLPLKNIAFGTSTVSIVYGTGASLIWNTQVGVEVALGL